MFVFRLPITYHRSCRLVSRSVLDDLEIIESKTDEPSLYQELFGYCDQQPVLEQRMIPILGQYYTTDISFLKDTQRFITSRLLTTPLTTDSQSFDCSKVVDLWKHIHVAADVAADVAAKETQTTNTSAAAAAANDQTKDTINKDMSGFHDKYQYVGWDWLKPLNNHVSFLQCLSLYSVVSPLISLALPLLILIVPFFILKFKQLDITMTDYVAILSSLISNHAMFKVFMQFGQVDTSQQIYLILSAGLYLFSLYQNMLGCIRVYTNMKQIHAHLMTFRQYIQHTLGQMDIVNTTCQSLRHSAYRSFVADMRLPYETLKKMGNDLSVLESTFSVYHLFGKMGCMMQQLYQFHQNESYAWAMDYSFGFHGYLGLMRRLSSQVREGKLTKTTFVKRQKKPILKNMRYPKFINQAREVTVANSCNLTNCNNIILTGANASGKTTILKTIMANVLYSQQFGYGCFDKLKLHPFDYLHCYLNIPDTSNRDSLFQSEARRCKDIIDCIQSESNQVTHLCIFDELYSGTNVDEAVMSGCAFMRWMGKQDHVCSILTTHFANLCHQLEDKDTLKDGENKSQDKPLITNMQMVSLVHDHKDKDKDKQKDIHHTYQMTKGISTIKGAIHVLHQLEYPTDLLDGLIYYG